MEYPKIHCLELVKNKVLRLKNEGKKIVLCHGHFNVIHPGHLRFLRFAKQQGDYLIVSIAGKDDLHIGNNPDFFEQQERAEGVASLEIVDSVYLLPSSVVQFIKHISPNIYVKGREFEKNQDKIFEEISVVEGHGGRVIFSSGEVEYASFEMFNRRLDESENKKTEFLKVCSKHEIDLREIHNSLDRLSELKFLVIGDTIVDQFVACDTLGVSSEAPVLAIRELQTKEFVGGAAIVAHHVRSMGAECHYISVVGKDGPADFIRQSFLENSIQNDLVVDENRPTTYKIRYMVEGQKVLRVSRLKQQDVNTEIENKIIAKAREIIPQVDGIILCDFVYGVITPYAYQQIQEVADRYNVKIFGDLQCSSQVGDVSKFQNIHLITPTEKEARIALNDKTSGLEKMANDLLEKTKNKNLVITLGAQGLLAHTYDRNSNARLSEFFPALETNVVDVAGAGDALLTGEALGLCLGLNLLESSALASCMSGISVMRLGNLPIKVTEIKQYLKKLIQLNDLLPDNYFSPSLKQMTEHDRVWIV